MEDFDITKIPGYDDLGPAHRTIAHKLQRVAEMGIPMELILAHMIAKCPTDTTFAILHDLEQKGLMILRMLAADKHAAEN